MEYTKILEELVQEAEWAPKDTKTQLDLYQKAVNFIDAKNMRSDYAIEVKCDFIRCAEYTGFLKLAIPQFTWLLKQMDDVGMEQFGHTYEALWMYKWMLNSIMSYAQFPKEKVIEMYEDMSARMMSYSNNKHVVYDYGYLVYHNLGLTKEAEEYKQKLLSFDGRGSMSDCKACVTTGIGNKIFEELGFAEFLEVSAPIISGKSKCTAVPRYSNSRISLAFLFEEGLSKNAKKFAKRDETDIKQNENNLTFCSYAIIYRVLINDLDRALVLANRQILHFFGPVDDIDKYNFSRAALLLLEKLIANKKEWIGLPELPNLEVPDSDKEAFLDQFFSKHYDGLIEAFDTRNGNKVFSQRAEGLYDRFRSFSLKELETK